MINVLITGCNGQLGSELRELSDSYSEYSFLFTDVDKLDITEHESVKDFILKNDIKVIINCAAYTEVDKAESSTEKANSINNLAVENFAQIASDMLIKLIHISTDYVFEGNELIPYDETKKPSPQSVYGKTKLDGENAIIRINPANTIIIRTSWLYSSYGKNFLKTMLSLSKHKKELNVINDQIGTPTYAGDLAATILEILPKINNKRVEIYHFSNEGSCSWYDFAKAIFIFKEINIKLNAIETFQFPTVVKRPSFSVLNSDKIKRSFNINIPNWKVSLKHCLEKINYYNT